MAYIIYKDMRTPGQYEEYYRNAQNDPGVLLAKGEIISVRTGADNGAIVSFNHKLLNESVEVEVDLVVLATGMVSASVIEADKAKQSEGETEKKSGPERAGGTEVLNLDYRQGGELPELAHGFLDSHFICFPYETRRTAIYAAGCLREPMDIMAAEDDANGAAMKAVQAVNCLERGAAVHPRSGFL